MGNNTISSNSIRAIKFGAKPCGHTSDFIDKYTKEGMHLAAIRPDVKKLIAEFFKHYATEWLSGVRLDSKGLDSLYSKYVENQKAYDAFRQAKNDKDSTPKLINEKETVVNTTRKELKNMYTSIQKSLANTVANITFMEGNNSKPLNKVSCGTILKDYLLPFIADHNLGTEAAEIALDASKMSTYYKKLFEQLQYAFDTSGKSGTIARRLVNDNLPKYMANYYTLTRLHELIDDESKSKLINALDDYNPISSLAPVFFTETLTQNSIDKYNEVIGHYNQMINLHNQNVQKSNRLKKLYMLYSLPLFASKSAIVDTNINDVEDVFNETENIFDFATAYINDFNKNAVTMFDPESFGSHLIPKKSLDILGKVLYGNKHKKVIRKALEAYVYEHKSAKIKRELFCGDKEMKDYGTEAYYVQDIVAALEEYSLSDEHKFVNEVAIYDYFKTASVELVAKIKTKYEPIQKIVRERSYSREDNRLIREFYDCVRSFKDIYYPLLNNEDTDFANAIRSVIDDYYCCVKLYNNVRNYLTKAPFSKAQYQLPFGHNEFGVGDSNGVPKSGSFFLKDGNKYYVATVDATTNKAFDYKSDFNKTVTAVKPDEDCYEFLYWRQLTDLGRQLSRIFITSKINPAPENIQRINKDKTYKVNRDDLLTIIKFYQEQIKGYSDYAEVYNLECLDKDPDEYLTFLDFCADVESHLYVIETRYITKRFVKEQNEQGHLFLFEIYSQDLSPNHRGKKDRQTQILEKLFTKENTENCEKLIPHCRLAGGTKLIYRPASLSIDNTTIHKAGEPILNKTHRFGCTSNEYRIPDYDIIKDKRFTEDKFSVTITAVEYETVDTDASLMEFNKKKNLEYKYAPVMTVLRNYNNILSYYVYDHDRNCLEKGHLNVIEHTSPNGNKYTVDYATIIKEAYDTYRENAFNWHYSKSTKDVIKGYLSAALGEIVRIQQKYHATIVFENAINEKFQVGPLKGADFTGLQSDVIRRLRKIVTAEGNVEYHTADVAIKDSKKQNGNLYFLEGAYDSVKFGKYINNFSKEFDYTSLKKLKDTFKKFPIWYDNGDFLIKCDYKNSKDKQVKDLKRVAILKIDNDWSYFNKDTRDYDTYNAKTVLLDILNKHNIDYTNGKPISFDSINSEEGELLSKLIKSVLSCKVRDGVLNDEFVQDMVVSIDGEAHVALPRITTNEFIARNLAEKALIYKETLLPDGTPSTTYFDEWLIK